MRRASAALTCLLALVSSDAMACSPNAPPVPRPGESDPDYRARTWSERLASPIYTNIFTARIAATIRDEFDTRSQPPYHVVVHVADVRVHRGKAPPDGVLVVDSCGGVPQGNGRILVATNDGYTLNGANAWTDEREFRALEQAMQRLPARLSSNPP
ncbi:MAG TPA: hypothetical protein VGE64_12395 [Xanthomonadaceae bacterium]